MMKLVGTTGVTGLGSSPLRMAGALAMLLVALAVARQVGLPDVVCGATFATAGLGALAHALRQELRMLGPARSTFWSAGLVAAALLPVMARLHPGRLLASGMVTRAGHELDLGPSPPREVLLAVAADVEEGASITYRLAAGDQELPLTLLRRSFRTEGQEAHWTWHVDRPSLVTSVPLPPGVRTLVFASPPPGAPPLRIRAYAPLVPEALPVGLSLAALAALLLEVGTSRATRRAAKVASMMVAAGLIAGALATPDHAFRATLIALPGGLLAGLAGGGGLHYLARSLRRRFTRQAGR